MMRSLERRMRSYVRTFRAGEGRIRGTVTLSTILLEVWLFARVMSRCRNLQACRRCRNQTLQKQDLTQRQNPRPFDFAQGKLCRIHRDKGGATEP